MTIHSFHARQDHHKSTPTWQMLIYAATTEAEVVATARDFLASFTPHEVDLLPSECRPHKLVDGNDVVQLGFDLTLHRWDEEGPGVTVLQAFSGFFADASERLAQIAAAHESGRESA